ncbi:MAG: isopentenyl-diphosphate delta-isomerase [Bacteroidota bacterium]
MENRKKDHIELAFESQTLKDQIDRRFYYEPVLNPHPAKDLGEFSFGDKKMKVPIWVSSMTGGTKLAGKINANLARACNEFGMGMGLGSCRIIMDDNTYFEDFNVRDIIGNQYPLYTNLGIAQVEELIDENETGKIKDLIKKLRADGLIIHVNPLQEWFQPEGDRLKYSPLDTIKRLLDVANYPVIVKEVGQGMGYNSLRELLKLPLLAIEFAAFGGTNFAKLELMRSPKTKQELFEPLSKVGHDVYQMLSLVNRIYEEEKIQTRQLIISGGVKSFLDGYYLINKSTLPAVYGMASGFLKYAKESYEELKEYTEFQIKGLHLAYNYLKINE